MAGHDEFDVILFDLGGVLVELDQRPEKCAWFDPKLTNADNWKIWLTSPLIQSFERGELAPLEFAEAFISANRLEVFPETFIASFKSWVVDFFPGVFPLLKKLSANQQLAVFSNITEVHWLPLFERLKQSRSVDYCFASYLLGRAKPEVDSYHYVANQMGLDPRRVFFIDDNILNVEGAQKAGMTAVQAKGIGEVERKLAKYGFV